MAMNPFGRHAFTGGEPSAITIPQGKEFRLRYGVLFHWHARPEDFDPQRAHAEYLSVVDQKR
jgi:hypothetical protein